MKCVISRDERYPAYSIYEAEHYGPISDYEAIAEIPEHLINTYSLVQEDYDDMQGMLEEYYNHAKETSKDT